MLVLFKMVSGDTWSPIYFEALEVQCFQETFSCGAYVTPVFFISLMIITRVILINIITSIIITQIESYFDAQNNIINFYKDNLRSFKDNWNELANLERTENEYYIPNMKLCKFLKMLGSPLGFNTGLQEILRNTMLMKINSHNRSQIHFRVILLDVFKYYYYKNQIIKFDSKEQYYKVKQNEKNVQNKLLASLV